MKAVHLLISVKTESNSISGFAINIIKKMIDDNNYSSILLSKVRDDYSLKSIKYLYEIYNFDIDIASKNLIKEMIGDIQEIIRLLSYINA